MAAPSPQRPGARTRLLLGGLVAAIVVAIGATGALAYMLLSDDDDPTLPAAAAPPTGDGDQLPGDLEDLLPDELPADGEVRPTAEARAFVEQYDVAGSVLHLAIAEQQRLSPDVLFAVEGDIWVELDDEGIPLRFVARYVDENGDLMQATYQDREGETIAFIDEARTMGELAEGCLEEGPGHPQTLADSLPFLVATETLTTQGFELADDVPEGESPTTQVDERVGEPDRILDTASWSANDAYTLEDPESLARLYVLLDPASGLLRGQVITQENDDGEAELGYRQGIGDIHVHAPGPAIDDIFAIDDAIALCEELTG